MLSNEISTRFLSSILHDSVANRIPLDFNQRRSGLVSKVSCMLFVIRLTFAILGLTLLSANANNLIKFKGEILEISLLIFTPSGEVCWPLGVFSLIINFFINIF